MIKEFKDNYRWLSNFYPSSVNLDGVIYPSVENAYQASKTSIDRNKFINCTPGEAKRLGRKVFIHEDWIESRVLIMRELLIQKFAKDSILGNMLVDTGNAEIIEGNTWGDTFWGVYNEVGENHLGKLIMEIRTEINGK